MFLIFLLIYEKGILSDIAENGQEAVDAVQRNGDQYDVIFMDHTMPTMVNIISYLLCSTLLWSSLVHLLSSLFASIKKIESHCIVLNWTPLLLSPFSVPILEMNIFSILFL